MKILVKRIYEPPAKSDGFRVLVDRLWPRGISKEKARIDYWFKEIAPSDGLRKSFAHEVGKWEDFRKSYAREIDSTGRDRALEILKLAEKSDITLLFAARDVEHNNAVVLKEYLEKKGK